MNEREKPFDEIIKELEDNTAPAVLNLATLTIADNRQEMLLAYSLNFNTSVTKVLFKTDELDDEQITKFALKLIDNETINEFDFSNCSIRDLRVANIITLLERNSALRSLSLRNNAISSLGALTLSNALQNTAIVYFDISGNSGIEAAAARCLWRAAAKNPNIISFACDHGCSDASAKIKLQREEVVKLAREWIEHKDKGTPLTNLLERSKKCASAIEYVLRTELMRPELASSFKETGLAI